MKTAALPFVMSLFLGLGALAAPAVAVGQEVVEEYAPGPPPAAPAEVQPVAPYPGAVWIGGHYRWRGGRWVWNRGLWERPRRGYVWAPHRWEYRGGRHVFIRGGWRRR